MVGQRQQTGTQVHLHTLKPMDMVQKEQHQEVVVLGWIPWHPMH
jgi:hypothetical protein